MTKQHRRPAEGQVLTYPVLFDACVRVGGLFLTLAERRALGRDALDWSRTMLELDLPDEFPWPSDLDTLLIYDSEDWQ